MRRRQNQYYSITELGNKNAVPQPESHAPPFTSGKTNTIDIERNTELEPFAPPHPPGPHPGPRPVSIDHGRRPFWPWPRYSNQVVVPQYIPQYVPQYVSQPCPVCPDITQHIAACPECSGIFGSDPLMQILVLSALVATIIILVLKIAMK